MIGKIFKNQDPMMGLPIETVPVIEDCYRAYKNFVKDRFDEELDTLNKPSESRCTSRASALRTVGASHESGMVAIATTE